MEKCSASKRFKIIWLSSQKDIHFRLALQLSTRFRFWRRSQEIEYMLKEKQDKSVCQPSSRSATSSLTRAFVRSDMTGGSHIPASKPKHMIDREWKALFYFSPRPAAAQARISKQGRRLACCSFYSERQGKSWALINRALVYQQVA